jgi:hypothetical protein
MAIVAGWITAGALAAPPAPVVPTRESGPISNNTPPALWGACVEDKLNHEWVWFGGAGGVSKEGALRTWIFRDGAWSETKLDDSERAGPKQAQKICAIARRFYADVANRYYVSESTEGKGVLLGQTLEHMLVCQLELIGGYKAEPGAVSARIASIGRQIAAIRPKIDGKLTVAEVAAAREIWQACVKIEWAVDTQPPPRGYPAMAYEPETKKIVLFGGEGIHGAYSDTWVYDCATRTWSLLEPPQAPSPRMGHGMVGFGGKVFLVGGQEPRGSMEYCAGLWQRLPMDVWAYDVKANTWTLLKAGEEKPSGTVAQPPVTVTISEDGKTLAWSADVTAYGKKVKEIAGSLALPVAAAATNSLGVPPGTIKVRGQGFDPAWYEAVPPADANAFQAFLKGIPANKWVNVKPPVRHVNRDWGTTVLDVEHDQLLHWAGGHSSHCGTDVAHFSLQTGRWHILYTPELAFESCYSNDGAAVPTLSGSPWAPHSYLSYGWDEVSKRMIWCGKHGAYRLTNPVGVFTYDPDRYAWEVPSPQYEIKGGWFDVERHKTCMARTPHGLAVWADKYGGSGLRTGLWMADITNHVFNPVAATDPKDDKTFPAAAFGDRHGMTYDAKRDRVLIFHFGIKDKQKIWSCDLKTKAVTVLEPKGSANFPADASLGREATYLPDDDLVLVCTSSKPEQIVLAYDCAADEWLEMTAVPSTIDKEKRHDPGYGVSTGIEWDARRKLLWLVQTDGSVYAMRFDRATAGLAKLADAKSAGAAGPAK